ncbi:MAG: M6 family metalloprotease domain-containing protein [Muribaculaceae bacterium]|nr:M6 family metalloprotease domain-containing protein [Muribaculaceae bacterium]
MKRNFLHIGLITVAAACGLQLSAKPAKQGLLTVPTSDGQSLTVRLAGDEYYHQYFTEDGYPLVEKDGLFYYCDFDRSGNPINSGIKAVAPAVRTAAAKAFLASVDKSTLEQRIAARAAVSPRRLSVAQASSGQAKAPAAYSAADDNQGPPYERGYGLFPDERFPAYGDQKAIVILVEYTDVKFKTNYQGGVSAIDYFTRMLNEDGFNDYGGTGSAAQYFRENSGNHFRPEFDVYGPIQLAHNQSYYGGNDWYGNDQNPGAMVKEACDQLDGTVDFRDYDRNNDGLVDNVFIFYAGMGEASGGSANTVWPHSWNMTSAGYSNYEVTYDGVRVYTYGCSNEWESGRPDGVGTFVHEFSHVMGLPDLYATSYTSSFTPGAWSAMDYGPYNNEGMTPPNYGAFERYALGWLKPREIDRAINATLQPVSENVCGVIRTPKDTEFFLVENRQQEGWDTYIPGHGMLIWHVDYNDAVWSSNKCNNTPSHQYVDIEEADGTQSEYSRDGDAFPGVSHKTSFTSSTNPAMKTWNGTAINYPITDIAEQNGLITFKVLGGAEETVDPVEILNPSDVTIDGFTLNWTAPEEGNDVILNVYYLLSDNPDINGESVRGAVESEGKFYLPGYRNLNMGSATSATLSGLPASVIYRYTVQQSSGWTLSEPVEGIVSTGQLTIEYSSVVAEEAMEVNSNGFTARWQELENATAYDISLFELIEGEPNYEENGFDDGLTMVNGWSSNAGNTYSMSSYTGKEVPSLRLSNAQWLKTPVYADGIASIKFWSRGNSTTTGDMIKVYAVTPDGQQLVEEVPVTKDEGGTTTEITSLPAGTNQVMLQFERNGNSGALALDDVVVGHGMNYVSTPVEEYTNYSVGNATSYVFTGLRSATPYGYVVRATDGELFSRPSKMMVVKTSNAVGVDQVASSSFAVNVANLVVTASTDDEIIVSDYTGSIVARGHYKVTLPRAGLYIISVPAQKYVRKVIVK